jgi:RNA polymerase sigma factor (sigma-70 family)
MPGSHKTPSEGAPFVPELDSRSTTMTAEFRPMLMRYFSKRLSERAEIEDLVHEVLTRLLRSPRPPQLENERSYVFQTAHRVLIDWLRKRETHHARDHESFDPEAHSIEDFAVDRVLLGQEELNRAMALLHELPERTRAIFVLRRLEGLRHAEIASQLGVSVSTVEKQMCMALEYLMEGMRRS